MTKIRNIISDFRFEISAGTRQCDANKSHKISKDEKHFAYDKTPGHRLNICLACAAPIIKKAQEELQNIANELPT